jgi:hypothetical protein
LVLISGFLKPPHRLIIFGDNMSKLNTSDFFDRQNEAKKKTVLYIFLFIAAVICTILVFYFLTMSYVFSSDNSWNNDYNNQSSSGLFSYFSSDQNKIWHLKQSKKLK